MVKKSPANKLLIGCASLAGLCLVLMAILFVINATRPAHSALLDRLSPLDKARLAEALHLRQALGEAVLPGWSKADLPVIVYNEAYLFLVGCPQPGKGWIKIPQGIQMGQAWEVVPGDDFYGQPYYRQKLPAPGVNSEGFTVQVGDRWVASLGTYDWMRISMADGLRDQLPAPLQPVAPTHLMANLLFPNSDTYVSLVLHEAVHAYQGMRAYGQLTAAEQVYQQHEAQYPYESPSFRDAWQVELDLLNQAMRSTDPEETRRLARAFLDQRAKRRKAANLSADLIHMERLKEWEEGMAKYGERSIYLLAANQETYRPIALMMEDPEFNDYRGARQKWDQEVDQMRREAGVDADGRFYYSGFAQAVLLDRFFPGWKERLFSEGVWLEDLLAQALQ